MVVDSLRSVLNGKLMLDVVDDVDENDKDGDKFESLFSKNGINQ
jgi:hypothetical protein